MSDYIKREDAIQSIITHDALKDFGDSRGYAEWLLNKAPSADVAPIRHGRWIDTDKDDPCYYYCSECHRQVDMQENYCPNCGARMDGDGE